jgi:hypothetical protein
MQYLAQMMRNAIANLCVDDDVSVRESYTGRGMFGRSCPGLTGSMSGCMAVIAEVIKEAHTAGVDNDEVVFEEVVDTLLDFRRDSMGRDVILYWPELPAFEEEPMGEVAGFYEGGVCPDCGELIPNNAAWEESCDNCGHVFNRAAPNDD